MGHRTVADDLERPRQREGGHRVGEGHEAVRAQTGGQADEVVLRDADVEEPRRKPVAKRLQEGEAEVCGEQDHALIARSQLDQRVYERSSHEGPTSSIAWRYWSSVIGR